MILFYIAKFFIVFFYKKMGISIIDIPEVYRNLEKMNKKY
jgi:hypothetical protein